MYVAITRAKERLWLTRSRSRYLYGKREPTMRSQFVDELKEELGIEDIKARYSGDYGDYGETQRSYGGYNNSFRSYGGDAKGSYGYGNSAPKRVGRASDPSENEYRTYGSATAPKKSSAPVRFGNVGSGERTQGKSLGGAVKKDVSQFSVGVKVRHPRFGDGVITATRGTDSNLIVTVKFETAGNKDLAAVLAPIEVIS